MDEKPPDAKKANPAAPLAANDAPGNPPESPTNDPMSDPKSDPKSELEALTPEELATLNTEDNESLLSVIGATDETFSLIINVAKQDNSGGGGDGA